MVKREPEEWSPSVPLHRRRRRRTKTWRLLLLLHHQPIIFDVRKSKNRERGKRTEREKNCKKKGGRIELENRRTEGGGEERGNISACPRGQTIYTAYEIYRKVSRRWGGGGWRVERRRSRRNGQEGSSFETKQVEKRIGEKEREIEGKRAKEKERLEAKPVIMRLPGATAADCYLVSTPTTLSPAILLPSTYWRHARIRRNAYSLSIYSPSPSLTRPLFCPFLLRLHPHWMLRTLD